MRCREEEFSADGWKTKVTGQFCPGNSEAESFDAFAFDGLTRALRRVRTEPVTSIEA